MINNGVPEGTKFSCADRQIDVEKYTQEALRWFGLNKDSFKVGKGDGFKYSIAEIVLLYLADGFDYLCYIQGDVMMEKDGNWVKEAIEILEKDNSISVVSPYSEVNTWANQEGLDQYFSDQAFIVRVPEFRKKIFSYKGFNKDYPDYGGDSFEHKVHKYLKNNGKYRKILNEYYCVHPAL